MPNVKRLGYIALVSFGILFVGVNVSDTFRTILPNSWKLLSLLISMGAMFGLVHIFLRPLIIPSQPRRILVLGLPPRFGPSNNNSIEHIIVEDLNSAIFSAFSPQAIFVNETFTLVMDEPDIIAQFANVCNAPVYFFNSDINLPPGIE